MSQSFKGVWASFEYIDEACAVISALRDQKKDYSVLSPLPHHELEAAMGEPQSRISFITLVFGGFGIFFGYGFPSYVNLDWVLARSSKPIISIAPFTIIGFEMMVLFGGLSTVVSIFLLGYLEKRRKRFPKSDKYKAYGRFTQDRFGVIVRCDEKDADAIEKLMRAHSAEEVVREY